MSMEPLITAGDVIDALGGTAETARKLKRSLQVITNWRTRGIPPEMFLVVTSELAGVGQTAAPSAFANMAVPSQEAAE